MVNEHLQEAMKIEDKYKPKYSGMAVKGWLSVGAMLIPHLAPLVSVVAPSWLAGHYVQTKTEERREKRALANSLLGIVATARNSLKSIE
jgi:ABC-type Fe3+ transport system permease subunit